MLKFSLNYISFNPFKNVRNKDIKLRKYFFEQGPCNFSFLKKFVQQGGENLLITRKN